MKKTLLKLLTLVLALCSVLTLITACSKEPEHVHNFDREEVAEEYFASEATCEDSIKYFLSCTCGAKGTKTFEYGEPLGHEFINYTSDNNATYDSDGTKTATCNRDGCNEKDTITDAGTKLLSHIEFKTLSLEETNVFSNETIEFSFNDEIERFGYSTFEVSKDKYGENCYLAKVAPLSEGENVFYVFEKLNGDVVNTYTVKLYRRPMHTVDFDTLGGSSVQSQQVEESFTASVPETNPTRAGYAFDGWDYDFTKPITQSITINAKWTANDNTAYKIEYYLQNLTGEGYALTQTENGSGTTDTIATIEPKDIEHFTFNNGYSLNVLESSINGDGSTVLKLYYTRNEYTLSIVGDDYGTITNAGSYRYGTTSFTSTAILTTENLGYTFLGWYNGDELLTKQNDYTFTGEFNVVAKFGLVEGMEIFNFTSTVTTCEITGLKDKTLTDVVIPDCVTSIDDEAFSSCYSLTSITIPNSVKSIGDYAFTECISLTSIEIPNSVTNIGEMVFSYCHSLTSIEISNSVTSIGNSAFYSCSLLASIMIPSNVTSIGSYAFSCCESLTSITISNSVTSIGSNAFCNCTSLTIYCEAESRPSGWNSDWNYDGYPVVWDCNNNDVAEDGYIYTIVNGLRYGIKDGVATVVRQPTNITTAVIQSNITYKGNNYSVTIISDDVFFNCTSLTSITVDENNKNYKSIDGNLYSYDGKTLLQYAVGKKDTSFVIPNSVVNIGERAFYNCRSLTSITIPNSVTSIGSYAFSGCSSLTIYCEAKSQPNSWISEWNEMNHPVVWDCNNNDVAEDGYIYTVVDGLKYGIKDGVAMVTNQSSNITTAVIPSSITYKGDNYSVTSIGDYAFGYCRSLTSIEISNSVTSIGAMAFAGCMSLTSIEIPNSVTSIGAMAFTECISLTSIEISSSVTSIGEAVFGYCLSLTSITVDENNKNYKSIDGNLYSYDGKTLLQYAIAKKDTSFVIPDSVTSIGYYAFGYCSSLTSIEIPNSVTSIGDNAFYNCSLLTSIMIPSNVTSIGFYAFAFCESLTSITIPNSVTSIGVMAFGGCASLTIYCEAESQPSGWDSDWNAWGLPVVWRYKG